MSEIAISNEENKPFKVVGTCVKNSKGILKCRLKPVQSDQSDIESEIESIYEDFDDDAIVEDE